MKKECLMVFGLIALILLAGASASCESVQISEAEVTKAGSDTNDAKEDISDSDIADIGDSSDEDIFEGTVINTGEHFIVYDLTKRNQPEYKPEYRYVIYSKSGDPVKDETLHRSPNIKYVFDNTALSISVGAGTGLIMDQYYDICTGVFSDIFHTVLAAEYGKIAFAAWLEGEIKLVVRDAFDRSALYQEHSLDDIAGTANPVDAMWSVEFIDESTILVTYLLKETYEAKTVIIQIE